MLKILIHAFFSSLYLHVDSDEPEKVKSSCFTAVVNTSFQSLHHCNICSCPWCVLYSLIFYFTFRKPTKERSSTAKRLYFIIGVNQIDSQQQHLQPTMKCRNRKKNLEFFFFSFFFLAFSLVWLFQITKQ